MIAAGRGPPRTLFSGFFAGFDRRQWDVAPDGQRFRGILAENQSTEIVPITLVVNWAAAVSRWGSRVRLVN